MKICKAIFLLMSLWVCIQLHAQAVNNPDIPEEVAEELLKKERRDVLDNMEVKNYPSRYNKPVILEAETTMKQTIKLENLNQETRTCNAELSIGYLQYNDNARVDAVIENNDCAASAGEYMVNIDVYDFTHGMKSIEHLESWSRNDDEPFKSQILYEIGDNVELIKVQANGLKCLCTVTGNTEQ